ncbi:hypothetical protein CWIS_13715 [Cellulomonas sp. A375-1]|uniref:hypothetical protein n=1 Tax=Cellulomonas sp. A375-1 TaxID=1672219 RepID=UPI000652824C|nr:hypothetical protein [Cellulomonas sp. A375-1]KMM44876.1 hypothetical protein CWIS_13715 [Cellulomonas sp. A375-1]
MAATIVTLLGQAVSEFPALTDADAVIQVHLKKVQLLGETELEVRSNLGASLTPELTAQAVGLVLHRLAHALLDGKGVATHLGDLDEPIPFTLSDLGGAG